MASAYECDICGKLYKDAIEEWEEEREFYIQKYHHGTDEYMPLDICNDCYKKLEQFVKTGTFDKIKIVAGRGGRSKIQHDLQQNG